MPFSDEMHDAMADVAAQLHEQSVTITAPAGGTLDPATGLRGGTPQTATFLARLDLANNARSGSRTITGTIIAHTRAIADAGMDTVPAGATAEVDGVAYAVGGTETDGPVIRMRVSRRV